MQVDGLTRLMMGAPDAEEGAPGKAHRENRRETWAPGAAGNLYTFMSLPSTILRPLFFSSIIVKIHVFSYLP